jgi:multiple antibiotic resistance protein
LRIIILWIVLVLLLLAAVVDVIILLLPITQSNNYAIAEEDDDQRRGNTNSNNNNNNSINTSSKSNNSLAASPNETKDNNNNNVITINTFLNQLQRLFSIPHTFGEDLIKSTIALLVVIDPIGTVPLFISLTEKMEKSERKTVSKTTVITAGILLLVFAVAGTQILNVFGITIFNFMIAGGVLLFIVSIELLTSGTWRFGDTVSGESGGVVPLAFPLLAGPGAITSVIISFQTSGLIVTILSIIIVICITYAILRLVNPIYRILGRRGSMIITRVFAVFIAGIAVQYIVEGVNQLFIQR